MSPAIVVTALTLTVAIVGTLLWLVMVVAELGRVVIALCILRDAADEDACSEVPECADPRCEQPATVGQHCPRHAPNPASIVGGSVEMVTDRRTIAGDYSDPDRARFSWHCGVTQCTAAEWDFRSALSAEMSFDAHDAGHHQCHDVTRFGHPTERLHARIGCTCDPIDTPTATEQAKL